MDGRSLGSHFGSPRTLPQLVKLLAEGGEWDVRPGELGEQELWDIIHHRGIWHGIQVYNDKVCLNVPDKASLDKYGAKCLLGRHKGIDDSATRKPAFPRVTLKSVAREEVSTTERLPSRQGEASARSSMASPRRDKDKAKEESDADSMSEETLVRKLRQVNREIRRQVKERQEKDRPTPTRPKDEEKKEVKEEKEKKRKRVKREPKKVRDKKRRRQKEDEDSRPSPTPGPEVSGGSNSEANPIIVDAEIRAKAEKAATPGAHPKSKGFDLRRVR